MILTSFFILTQTRLRETICSSDKRTTQMLLFAYLSFLMGASQLEKVYSTKRT